MKKLSLLLGILLTLILITGCFGNAVSNSFSEIDAKSILATLQNDNEQFGIVVEVEPQIISINHIPKQLRIKITNYSNYFFNATLHHRIEFHNGEGWVSVMPPQIFLDFEFIRININEAYEFWSLPLGAIENLVAGKYRIAHGDMTDYNYGIFFIIN